MLDMSELTKAEEPRSHSPGEPAAQPPAAALLRHEQSVRTHRGACGPCAAVRRPAGGGGDRGVPLRGHAKPVCPGPRAEDLLLRDTV